MTIGITSDDLLDLCDAVRELARLVREEAERNHERGVWGAARCLEDALYDLHGAAGCLALDEGKLDHART